MKRSQADQIHAILSDGYAHRTDEIAEKVYGITQGVWFPRIGARVWDCKHKYQLAIESWPDPKNKKLWWYRIAPEQYALPLDFQERGNSMVKGLSNGVAHPQLGEALREQQDKAVWKTQSRASA